MRVVLVFTLLMLAGCSDPPQRDPSQWPVTTLELEQNAPTDDPAEAHYRRYCLACHGNNGKGNDQTTGADFTRAGGVLTQADDALLASVRDGKSGSIGTMPAHRALLTEPEIRAVLGYVRGRWAPPAADVPPTVQAPAAP